ncbi:MAG: helix-turn-helix domain-containing protein, partial [Verrucomicrobiaceae bacterium]
MDIPENPVIGEWKTPFALASLTEAQRAAALERFRVIHPHLENGVLLTVLAISTGISCRTLSRWVSLYRKGGLAELARRGRDDKGGRRGFSARILQAVEGLALRRPRLPVATISRKIRQLAEDLGEKPPGYKVIHGIIRKLPPNLVMLAQEGVKAHSEAFDLVHRQEAARPNAVWQADHCLLDITVLREEGD